MPCRLATFLFAIAVLASAPLRSAAQSGASGPGPDLVLLEPVRASWPAARDSYGTWSTVGEVVIRNSGTSPIKVKQVSADFRTAEGASLVTDRLPKSLFKKRLLVYTVLGDGTVVAGKPGTAEIKPGGEALALLSGLKAASAPSSVAIQVQLAGGETAEATVPVTDASGFLELAFPVVCPESDTIKGAAINTFDTPYHRAAFLALPDGRRLCSQRYASDLLLANIKTEKPAPKGAKTKEEHYAWDREVICPAEGTVVFSQDGNPDVELGKNDFEHPLGNHLVVRHAPGVFTLYAHLRQGSVLVRAGDAVVRGQALGRVGSSGASELPHLHFHVMDAWEGPDDLTRAFASQGLPALIEGVNVLRGGSLVPLDGAQLMERDVIAGPSGGE